MIELELSGARVRFKGRAGGVSAPPYDSLNLGILTADDPAAVRENLRIATQGRPVAVLRQVHGAEVLTTDRAEAGGRDGDGLVTNTSGLVLAALTADCIPVALASAAAVGMIHAGWRGVAGGVIEAGVTAILAQGAGPVHAALGPSARACCYEIGPDVAARFPAHVVSGGRLDLQRAAWERLESAGVETVVDTGRCTMCEPSVFFSHRRNGPITGRQAGLIWRSSSPA